MRRVCVVAAMMLTLLIVLGVAFESGCGGSRTSSIKRTDPRDAIVGKEIARLNAWIWMEYNGTGPYDADLGDLRFYYRKVWPKNPFTGKPMGSGTAPGDYRYLATGWTGGEYANYLLSAFGADGKPVVQINGGGSLHDLQEGLQVIAASLHAWANNHGGAFPEPAFVTQQGLGALSQYFLGSAQGRWPTNPLSGQPMAPGPAPGEFNYTRSSDGRRFTLVGSVVDWTNPLDGWSIRLH